MTCDDVCEAYSETMKTGERFTFTVNLFLTRNVVDFSDFVRRCFMTSKKVYPNVGEVIGKIFTDFYRDKLARVISNIPEVRSTKVSRLVSNFPHVC